MQPHTAARAVQALDRLKHSSLGEPCVVGRHLVDHLRGGHVVRSLSPEDIRDHEHGVPHAVLLRLAEPPAYLRREPCTGTQTPDPRRTCARQEV